MALPILLRSRLAAASRGGAAAVCGALALVILGAPVAWATPEQGAPSAFTKGPYLQWLGPTGVTVKVELASPAPVSLAVFTAGDGGKAERVASVESAEPRAFHALRVDGLLPATIYDYRISAGGEISDEGHFTTAPGHDGAASGPIPQASAPFRFLVYGDSRTDHAAHAAVVKQMSLSDAAFLVNTGDMVGAGKDPADWQTFFDVERALLRDRCVFAAVGNHELTRGDPAGEVAFLRYFGRADSGSEPRRLYGSFRWSNTRFFMLNAMDTWTGDESAWLRDELERALVEPGLSHRMVILHHGPFSSGRHGGNQRLIDGGALTLMRDRKVDLIIAGHDHAYERGAGAGLKYVISGGAGAPLYKREHDAPETLRFESVHHFVEVEVKGEQVHLVARRASGSVIEACGFHGTGPWACDQGAPPASGPAAPAGKIEAPPPPRAPAASPSPRSRAGACGCGLPAEAPHGAGWIAALAAAALCWAGRRRDRCA